MGLCGSAQEKPLTSEELKERALSERINKEQMASREQDQLAIKLLLLGKNVFLLVCF